MNKTGWFWQVVLIGAMVLAAPAAPPEAQGDPNGGELAGQQVEAGEADEPLPAVSLLPEPNEPPDATMADGQLYSQPRYHPRVTVRVFALLSYPYYVGGLDYAEVAAPVAMPEETILAADPCQAEEVAEKSDTEQVYGALTNCCDLIYQWRQLNELPSTALEVVYAIELTRLSTRVYRTDAALAVQVKRTIGRIGRLNRRFDLASRLAVQSLLNGHIDRPLIARLEKQIAELTSLLELLRESNDAISIALGAGKIDRAAAWPDDAQLIDYSSLAPVEP